MKREYLTPEEVAFELKLSKYTVYEMIKRGELTASRIGRTLRIARTDLERFIHGHRQEQEDPPSLYPTKDAPQRESIHEILFAGSHDLSMDLLVHHIALKGVTLLPVYAGSMEGLIEMFKGRVDIAGCHLMDKSNGQYNLPHIAYMLPSQDVTMINLVHRWQGFIVPKGNPRNITGWSQFLSGDYRILNRQKGSGTRVLLDQKLQELGISPASIPGYDQEGANHYATASAVLRGEADVVLGIESAARSLGLDFFPIHKERYDLVIHNHVMEQERFQIMIEVLQSPVFQQAVLALGGYDVSQTGQKIASFT